MFYVLREEMQEHAPPPDLPVAGSGPARPENPGPSFILPAMPAAAGIRLCGRSLPPFPPASGIFHKKLGKRDGSDY